MTPAQAASDVQIRAARPEDAAVCADVCYQAFNRINVEHGFPPDFPSVDAAREVLTMMFTHPGFYCVVAESGGRAIGSNCVDLRGEIAGIGPITLDPAVQNHGAGRRLMQAVMERAKERGCSGMRLIQAAFHNRSLALYTSLGFDVREPLCCVQGPAIKKHLEGCQVRAAEASDAEACNELARRVHGHDRGGELADAIGRSAVVVQREGRITGYASAVAFSGHAVAETNLDLEAMIADADAFGGPGLLVPTRNAELMRWCLRNGLRIVQPLTLMTTGLYREPQGAYLASILY